MSFISYLINGISLGSVYAIIALGYTMVYGIAKMLNFAHGDVIMIGAYMALITMMKAGMSPIEAWQRYLLDKQKLKLAMMERENKNRLAAAPDVRSSGRYDEDGFVKALFGR